MYEAGEAGGRAWLAGRPRLVEQDLLRTNLPRCLARTLPSCCRCSNRVLRQSAATECCSRVLARPVAATPSSLLLLRCSSACATWGDQGGKRQADMLLPWTRPLPHMSRSGHSSFTVASHPTCNQQRLLYPACTCYPRAATHALFWATSLVPAAAAGCWLLLLLLLWGAQPCACRRPARRGRPACMLPMPACGKHTDKSMSSHTRTRTRSTPWPSLVKLTLFSYSLAFLVVPSYFLFLSFSLSVCRVFFFLPTLS